MMLFVAAVVAGVGSLKEEQQERQTDYRYQRKLAQIP
jgi:hypothetical protein